MSSLGGFQLALPHPPLQEQNKLSTGQIFNKTAVPSLQIHTGEDLLAILCLQLFPGPPNIPAGFHLH